LDGIHQETWGYSIAMLVYQRISTNNISPTWISLKFSAFPFSKDAPFFRVTNRRVGGENKLTKDAAWKMIFLFKRTG